MSKKETISKEFSWNYAAAPEAKDHIRLNKKYDLFINGKFVKPNKGAYFNM